MKAVLLSLSIILLTAYYAKDADASPRHGYYGPPPHSDSVGIRVNYCPPRHGSPHYRPNYYTPPRYNYYPPRPVYYAPRPVYYAPRPVYYKPYGWDRPQYHRGYNNGLTFVFK